MIRYSEAKEICATYKGIGGSCASDPGLDLFVHEVLDYLLYKGSYGNERTFEFHAEDGCITLPYELQTPLKIRINGSVGSVWNRWFEYHWGQTMPDNECLSANALYTQPNRYPTLYNMPACGGFVGVQSTCREEEGAHVVVKGMDANGKQIFTYHKGEQVVGEYISLDNCKIIRSTVRFAKITEVAKPKTKGHVTLMSIQEDGYKTFLSTYNPFEENPAYQRAKIRAECPPICSVSVLGRIRLKENYADDDLLPFDNKFAISLAAQTVNAMRNDKVQEGIAKNQFLNTLVEEEGNYNKVNPGQPLDVFKPISGGAVLNARAAGRKLRRGPYRA